MRQVKEFWRDRQAQDLIEYTLMLAFVAPASAGLFIGAGGGVSTVWGHAATVLNGTPTGVCDAYGNTYVTVNGYTYCND